MNTHEPAPRLRLFCAITLSDVVRVRAYDHLRRLRESAPQVKASWERAEKLHVTLKFLGATAAERLGALTEAAARAASSVSSFELTLAGAGAFPPTRAPRILWLGVEDTHGRLASLHERLETECAAAGFPRDSRPLHAHVTLARIRAANAAARRLAHYHQLLGFAPLRFTVNALLLMRSDLAPNGSQYTTLARFTF
jgi:RNA 2',3'-cyclic 3'-phosphodiesterase